MRWSIAVALFCSSCLCVVAPAPEDGGLADAGALDAGAPVSDGGTDSGVDAGVSSIDSGVDAGALDSGTVDAGSSDAGPIDAGTIDAGSPRVVGVRSVASGLVQTCAAMLDGGVLCWGDNTAGSLGRGSVDVAATLPAPVVNVSKVLTVTAGYTHACAVSDAGLAWCWGAGEKGQLGLASRTNVNSAQLIFDGGIASMAAAGDSTCALTTVGAVWCSGVNVPGVEGGQTFSFVPLAFDAGAVELVGGTLHFCARFGDGGVQCWGDDSRYLLGAPSDGGLGPKPVPLPAPPVRLTASYTGTCALYEDAGATCWGSLGEMPHGPSPLPMPVNETFNASYASGCQARAGTVECFGSNDRAQLGRPGLTSGPLEAGPVVGLSGSFTQIAGTIGTVCALGRDTSVWCWGDDYFLATGSGDPGIRFSPVHTQFPARPLALGYDTACYLRSPGGLECIGALAFSSALNASQVSVAYRHVLALYNGVAYGFGYDFFGELEGQPSGAFMALGFGQNNQSVVAGDFFSCVLASDGGVLCAGRGDSGQLGRDAGGTSAPLALVPNIPSASSIRAAPTHACTLQPNGQAQCWGANGSGELGRPFAERRPGIFGSTTLWADVQVGHSITVGLTSGDVFFAGSWGGGAEAVPTPTDIHNARAIAAASQAACALVGSGEVRCLGSNQFGALGVDAGTLATVASVQVPLQNVVSLVGGGRSFCATHTDGGVSCWGDSRAGHLNDGSRQYQTSAVPVRFGP